MLLRSKEGVAGSSFLYQGCGVCSTLHANSCSGHHLPWKLLKMISPATNGSFRMLYEATFARTHFSLSGKTSRYFLPDRSFVHLSPDDLYLGGCHSDCTVLCICTARLHRKTQVLCRDKRREGKSKVQKTSTLTQRTGHSE